MFHYKSAPTMVYNIVAGGKVVVGRSDEEGVDYWYYRARWIVSS